MTTCAVHLYPSSSIPSAECGAPTHQAFPTTTTYVACSRGHVTMAPAKHVAA